MNYVIWDIETDSAQLDWATMIEIGAILLDENFNEKDRFTARCRMPQDRVPSATALCINKSNVDLITKGNLSHYEMIAQVEAKFREWSPATFMGFSSVGFDDEILRREFFKSLRKPYLINTEGNSRHDALNMIKAAFAIDENVLKTEINPKGNKSMKLESLARLNGFNSEDAHSALFDTELTVKVLGLLKNKQPDLWHEYLKTKRSNIQQIFVLVRRVKSETQLDNRLGILNNQIHSYKVLLLYSLNMVTSVVEGDLIKYYEIYEKFDKLNLFNSNHENEMSKKLSDVNKSIEQVNRNLNKIENGITGLLESIDRMEMNILGQLDYLTYVTEDSFSELEESLSRELGSINSSIQTNNLLTGIQTYQLYKINKNTKGLRE